VGGSDEKKLIKAEQAAVDEMKSYLNSRYNTAKIFYLLSEFDDEATYKAATEEGAVGDLVFFKKEAETEDESFIVYECIEDTAADESPESDPDKWREFAGRNPFVIMYLVDIVMYHIHSKDATRLMPKVREDRYQDALDWMKMVAKGTLEANLPQLPITDANATSDIRFNSHEAEDNRW